MRMTEQSILLPAAMKAQCRAAEKKLEQDNINLRTVQGKLQEFLDDESLSGKAYASLKDRVSCLLSVIDAMVTANELDLADIRELAGRVGEQKLEGRVILSEIAEARREGEAFREQASQYYSKASGPLVFEAERQWYRDLGDFYSTRAGYADRRGEIWRRREERYNEIEESTENLFAEGMSLREAATRGLNALEGPEAKAVFDFLRGIMNMGKKPMKMPSGGATEALEEAAGSGILKAEEEMKYLLKYVNEETLCLINPRWGDNRERFKEVYGENVYVELRECMYRYGITDEVSILMFLSTMGEETGYGAHVLQGNGWGNWRMRSTGKALRKSRR